MILVLIATLVFLLWVFGKKTYSYWERKGFPYEKPSIPFGNLDSVRTREKSFGMAIFDIYQKTSEPFLGIYLLFRPAILVRNANLARDILTKDFASFHDRGVYVDEEKNQFSGNLFALEGKKWKDLRSKLTPSFTSGKLKAMFQTILETANNMRDHVLKELPENGSRNFEIKEILTRFAVDIIGSVIFGLEVNSFKEPNNEFHQKAMESNSRGIINTLQGLGAFLVPKLSALLHALHAPDPVGDYMKKIVREIIEYREKNNIVRKDMMQMFIQLRNAGKVNTDDNNWNIETVADSLKSMTMDQIAAQGFLFLAAGFETTASTASYCLYELAQNPELMEKLLVEIDEALERHNGEISYESIKEMKLLDKCVMETNRKFPGLPILNRKCTKDYQVPNSKHVIEKGTPIIISLMGLHRDPEYFPDPLKFDPERFNEDDKRYDPVAYMPFGEGPRNCIAFRLGRMSAKVAIVMMLSNFKFESIEKKELEIDNYAVVIMPKGGINVKLSRK